MYASVKPEKINGVYLIDYISGGDDDNDDRMVKRFYTGKQSDDGKQQDVKIFLPVEQSSGTGLRYSWDGWMYGKTKKDSILNKVQSNPSMSLMYSWPTDLHDEYRTIKAFDPVYGFDSKEQWNYAVGS